MHGSLPQQQPCARRVFAAGEYHSGIKQRNMDRRGRTIIMARMPAAVVLAAILVVDCCGKKSDAASSGDLLLLNNASDSVEAWTQQGDRSGQVALAVPGTTVMPGAVTDDGTYALNPATGSQNPADDSSGLPLLIITQLRALQPKVVARVAVPQPPGLSRCTFDQSTLQGGVLVTAGPRLAAGRQYPVAAVLRCQGNICTDSYLAVYKYRFVERARLQTLRSYANFGGGPGPVCTNESPDLGGGVYQPASLLYADEPYIIATLQNGSTPNAYGVAALFSMEDGSLMQRGSSDAFSDIHSASCNNFVWLRNASAADADDPRLAASCFLKGPGRTVVIHTSYNLGNNVAFDRVNTTLTEDGLDEAPLSINRVDVLPGQPLQERRLFHVQGDYTSIAYIA